MKKSQSILAIVCFTYVVVFLVLRITEKPNFDFFAGHLAEAPTVSWAMEVMKKKEAFLNQEMEQGAQNQRINALRNKVDKLRQDLDIIKKKERDETNTIYQQLKSDDSIAQAVGVNQGRDMRNLLGNGGKSGKMGGKDYNLNFNLE